MSQYCLNCMNVKGEYTIRKIKNETESYNQYLSFYKVFNFTPKIKSSNTIKYTKFQKGTRQAEVITPTCTLNFNNDIFNLDISGTLSETLDTKKDDTITKFFNATYSSFYKKIVNLKLTYTKSTNKDKINPHRINNTSKDYGFSLKRNFFKYLSLNYDYKKTKTKNKVDNTTIITFIDNFISSITGLNYNFNNFNFTFSLNYNFKKSKIKSSTSDNGIAKFPIEVNFYWEPNMNKGDILKLNQEIIIQIPLIGIDLIEIYSDINHSELILSNVKWDIYISDTGDENSWELLYSNINFPFKFPKRINNKGYLKLKVISLLNDIELTAPFVKCYVLESTNNNYAKLKIFSRSLTTNASISHEFNENIDSFYNINFSFNNPSPGEEVKNISHSLLTHFNINKIFSPAVTISQNIKYNQYSPDTSNIDFSFTNTSEFLNTLSTTFSYSHSINFIESKKTNSSNNLNVSINAKIFPDLLAKLENTFSLIRNYESNSTTKTYSANLGITARFTTSLTLTSNYSLAKVLSPKSNLNQNILLNLSWRVSERMFINFGENVILPDKEVKKFTHNLSLWAAPTKKIQFNLTYTGNRGDETIDSFSNFLSWKLNNNWSLKFIYNHKIIGGKHKWDSQINLSFIF